MGSQVARLLAERSEDAVLFDANVNMTPVREIKDNIKIIQGSLPVWQ